MKITLLPHQIIIFPHAILGNLDVGDFAEGSPQYEMYNNEEIRYYINRMYIIKYFQYNIFQQRTCTR
jgi:hypothetical protein